jgi:hypothetical protein
LFNIWFLTDRVNKTPAGRFKTSSRPAQVKLKTGASPQLDGARQDYSFATPHTRVPFIDNNALYKIF